MLYFCSYLLIFFSALFFLFKVFEQKKGSNQSEKNVFIQKSSIGNNSITINGNDIEKKINGKVNSIIQNGNKIIVNGINITDLIAKDVFENSIDERFPNRDFLLEERNHNHLVLKKLLNMLVNKDEIFNIYLYFKENFKKSKKLYKNKKKQTMLEYWTLEEKHQNGEIYLYYFEPFYKYRGLYSEANNIIKKLERLSKM